ncbi:MAG: hypothetical protein K8Q91_01750 [Candidatus Vogelbacteria bacterium]|jgi:hypothetical protein|nr:hypothetical protein [Candidatus Vogelbacteria bacterium]
MSKIYTSASKIVFILMAVAVIVGMFYGKVDAKDFMILASMAFSFYFANKGESNEPFAGK